MVYSTSMFVFLLLIVIVTTCLQTTSGQVTKCWIGVHDSYANPITLTMMDLSEINTYKLIDCNKAHYPKEIVQVNERRYEFGDENGAKHWVCSKVPNNGIVKKDCVPKEEAPHWYEHLLQDPDMQGCNGGLCYCDDQDGCNTAVRLNAAVTLPRVVVVSLLFSRL